MKKTNKTQKVFPFKEVSREAVLALPKTDLHVHLDGSLRLKTIIELAQEFHVELPTYDEEGLKKLVCVGDSVSDLVEYLRAFEITTKVMQDRDAISRTAFELAEDNAKENVRYIEVRFAPILHTNHGLKFIEIVDAVLEGLELAEKRYNIQCGLILCAMRHMPPQTSVEVAELCLAYKNRGVVGFDLAGAEVDFPPKEHRNAFFMILNNNLNCTVHAGEAYGPESIHQAIHYCGAHRIGHGTRLKEDGDLFHYVNDHRIPLEICLKSNVQTKTVSSIQKHPFKFYYEHGLRVTLNTDNRLVSETTVTDEYLLAASTFGYNMENLYDIAINGFKSAFLPQKKKIKMLDEILQDLGRPSIEGRQYRQKEMAKPTLTINTPPATAAVATKQELSAKEFSPSLLSEESIHPEEVLKTEH